MNREDMRLLSAYLLICALSGLLFAVLMRPVLG